jgi:hypothetical protein
MPDQPNKVRAVVALLRDNDLINSACQGRVYAHELPDVAVALMPQSCIVVQPAGSANAFAGGTLQLSDERMSIRFIAPTYDRAYALYEEVRLMLKNLTRTTIGQTVLQWARKSGGPTEMRHDTLPFPDATPPDSSLHWPEILAVWQVMASDIAPQEVAA